MNGQIFWNHFSGSSSSRNSLMVCSFSDVILEGLCYNSIWVCLKLYMTSFSTIDISSTLRSTGLIGPTGRVECITAWTCYHTLSFSSSTHIQQTSMSPITVLNQYLQIWATFLLKQRSLTALCFFPNDKRCKVQQLVFLGHVLECFSQLDPQQVY